eukprot:6522550-Pyramimonas_sp.AAC.1
MMRVPERRRHGGGGGRNLRATAERTQAGHPDVLLNSLNIPKLRRAPRPHLGININHKHRMHTGDDKATRDILGI